MLKKIDFQVNGMHCRACKTLIETEVAELPGVDMIEVDHASGLAHAEFDSGKASQSEIFKTIEGLNYSIVNAPEKPETTASGTKPLNEFLKYFFYGALIPLALTALVGGYLALQHAGGFALLARLNETNVSLGIIFLIGLMAGFHCVGMCGGLVVAYSSRALKRQVSHPLLPHLEYNAGRMVSYTVIGGILGGVGTFFAISPVFTGAMIIFAGVFMVLFGLSLFTDFKLLAKLRLKTPDFVARFLYKNRRSKNPKGPLVVGLLNGFMPCGPLQAMQLYALTTGSITRGALAMAVYALGTTPLLFGFGTAMSKLNQRFIGKMMKVSGALVLVLGLVMANRGLVNFGYGLNFTKAIASAPTTVANMDNFQEVDMDLTYLGYEPNTLYIKPGIPVRWVINVKQMTSCTDAIQIKSLNIHKDLSYGINTIEFTPPAGVDKIDFSCWMEMVWGKFIVTDGDTSFIPPAQAATVEDDLPGNACNGSCGGACGVPACSCGN